MLRVEVLAGAELLQEIEKWKQREKEIFSKLQKAKEEFGNIRYYLNMAKIDKESHLEKFEKMNVLGRMLNMFNIKYEYELKCLNKKIEEYEAICVEKSHIVDKINTEYEGCLSKIKQIKKDYEKSPHGLNAARQELQKRQEEKRLKDSQVQRQERQKPLEKKEPHQQHSQTPRLRMR